MRPLLWVSKSLDKLTSALVAMGHAISPNSVRKRLTEIDYSRQVNRKADEGTTHPDRNAQFEYINAGNWPAAMASLIWCSVRASKSRPTIFRSAAERA
jgi:hypothetical protein